MQKLILPINKTKLTASWKTSAYQTKFGFVHYGVDMVSTAGSTVLYASGDGEVVGVGLDNVVGNVIAVRYYDALHRPSGRSWDVVFRYFHLAKINVKVGQKVNKDTVLGNYGNTGMLSMASHLHLEADTDVKYPMYSPTLGTSSNIIRSGTDSMLRPVDCMHVKTSPPDNQKATRRLDVFSTAADVSFGRIE